ncbi:hypothetical protein GRF59_06705 [Paenibacillus sp. HJL G12]|uniref:Uncharacterized protein n=1 Tax=Paenibacillus dendrobii TaxID=2691084 RepID=A0A7X3IG56_9BACL|nr:hypothetical protein [Paenibacillus dendrobii]MWV43319.1 hypothetical protein [Paenibacillus dendrobii]
MEQKDSFYQLFSLTELGFKIISALIILVIVIGIIAIFVYRHRISGKKIMFFGAELILVGFLFNFIQDFKIYMPSLSFVTILLGLLVSLIGLVKKD